MFPFEEAEPGLGCVLALKVKSRAEGGRLALAETGQQVERVTGGWIRGGGRREGSPGGGLALGGEWDRLWNLRPDPDPLPIPQVVLQSAPNLCWILRRPVSLF